MAVLKCCVLTPGPLAFPLTLLLSNTPCPQARLVCLNHGRGPQGQQQQPAAQEAAVAETGHPGRGAPGSRGAQLPAGRPWAAGAAGPARPLPSPGPRCPALETPDIPAEREHAGRARPCPFAPPGAPAAGAAAPDVHHADHPQVLGCPGCSGQAGPWGRGSTQGPFRPGAGSGAGAFSILPLHPCSPALGPAAVACPFLCPQHLLSPLCLPTQRSGPGQPPGMLPVRPHSAPVGPPAARRALPQCPPAVPVSLGPCSGTVGRACVGIREREHGLWAPGAGSVAVVPRAPDGSCSSVSACMSEGCGQPALGCGTHFLGPTVCQPSCCSWPRSIWLNSDLCPASRMT